jgi:hypothetical protein
MTGAPATAQFTPMTDASGKARKGAPIPVHFNPETLTLTIRNTMEAAKRKAQKGRPAQQLVSASEVTLGLQLLFDTTLTGADVRTDTARIAEMMRPGTAVAGEEGKRRPAVALFEWNAFAFEGIISDYSETLDYFSPEGIPLRSNLNLTLTKHEAAFPAAGGSSAEVGAGAGQPTVPVSSGDSVSDVATSAGKPEAAPAIAAANQVEDFKNPEVEELAEPGAALEAAAAAGAFGSPLGGGAGAFAGAGIEFGSPPAAFASGDAGFGLDLGLSAGASAGISLSAGASLAAGASLGGGADLSGAAALAGASASVGAGLELDAFAGLNPPSPVSASASLGKSVSFDFGAEAGIGVSLEAGVSLGGAAGISLGAGAGAGFGGGQVASVGKEINLADILFEEEA